MKPHQHSNRPSFSGQRGDTLVKCTVCKEAAIIKLPAHNSKFCPRHFDNFFLRLVAKAIKRYHMLEAGEKVMVAVSGGKDSLTAVDVLSRLGYSVTGVHLDLGIDENKFSDNSLDVTQKFFAERNLPLVLFSLRDNFEKNMEEAGKHFDRFCSFCGMTKRYLMNSLALKHRMDVVATGHNLDDLSTALLANIMRWKVRFLNKGVPCLPPQGNFLKKIKPLALLSEEEIVTYTSIQKIQRVQSTCPHSREAKFKRYHEVLQGIEEQSPGTRRAFYEGYVRNVHVFSGHPEAETRLRSCIICEMPTTQNICTFCKYWRDTTAHLGAGNPI